MARRPRTAARTAWRRHARPTTCASEAFCLGLMTDLDTRTGRIADAGRHLRESLELSTRIGDPFGLLTDLDRAGLLCVATGRWAEAITLWAAFAARARDDDVGDVPYDARRREEASRQARAALGPAATRAAEQRGEAMTLATAIELAAMITVTEPPDSAAGGGPGGGPASGSARGNRNWSRWSPAAALTPRSRRSCSSACARSVPTWTGSGTRPGTGGGPISPGWLWRRVWSSGRFTPGAAVLPRGRGPRGRGNTTPAGRGGPAAKLNLSRGGRAGRLALRADRRPS